MIAKDVMTKTVHTVTFETPVYKAIGVLVDKCISGVPVLDDNGDLAGIVTEKDLLVSLDFVGNQNLRVLPVAEIMTKQVITYPEDAPVKDISAELVRRNIKRVPIVSGKKVVGIVSRRDILRSVRKKV